MPQKNRQAGAELRGRLEEIGIFRKSGHEHFSGSLVIPVFDESNRVTEMYGRKINDRLRKGTPFHLYLPGPHRGVWNAEALKASTEIILCESLIDALTFWCADFRNVTASYGIEGFTDDHLAAFKQYNTERVLIAYDRDEAGERAASSLAAKLMGEGIECFRILFPHGMDANEYALQVRPAEKRLGLVIQKAEWMGKGQRPDGSVQTDSVGADFEAAKRGKNDDSECRVAVNPPPCPVEEKKSGVNPDATRKGEILASPLPEPASSPSSTINAEVKENEVTFTTGIDAGASGAWRRISRFNCSR